jgi:tRNA (guanine-N7-)-methyltransferase
MGRVRVHQHVNPLSPYYRQPPKAFEMSVFSDTSKPLLLDIGCARGRFLLRMAEVEPAWNYLGVEIREPLVDEANRLAEEAGLDNLHYSFCNAMFFIDTLLEGIPAGTLQKVTIQFPDPWFKRKHAKRRMVNEEMVECIAKHLAPGCDVLVQTDIEDLAEEMFTLFRANENFTELPTDKNPFPVRTEREKAVEDKSLPVYRTIFKTHS